MTTPEVYYKLLTIDPKVDRALRDRIGILRHSLGVDVTIQELARDRHSVDYGLTVVGDMNSLGLVISYIARAVRPIG